MNSKDEIIIRETKVKELSSIKEVKNLAENINSIVKELQTKRDELTTTIDDLEDKKAPIEKSCIKTVKVSKTVNNIYEDFKKVNTEIFKTFKTTNEYILSILDFIKILSTIDVDVYEMLDKQSLNINEFKQIFKDYCKEKGIESEDVEKLFETSFQRAYQLRDKINSIRVEFQSSLQSLEERIKLFEEKFTNLDIHLETKIKEIYLKVDETIGVFTLKSEELVNMSELKIAELHDITKLSLNKQLRDIENLYSETDIQVQSLQNELRNKINKEVEDIKNFLEKQLKEQNTKIESLESKTSLLEEEVKTLKIKPFLDSTIYKISVGLIAIASLICAIIL